MHDSLNSLSYLERAAGYPSLNPEAFSERATIGLITNFTDGILQKFITGLCLEAGIYPTLSAEGYKQYHFTLRAAAPAATDITFIVFDASPFMPSEFTVDPEHIGDILQGIRSYVAQAQGQVVLATIALPSASPYGNLFAEDPLYLSITGFNEELRALARAYAKVSICDTDRLMRAWGEHGARDMRALYAFDAPFSKNFSLHLARELVSYLLALRGRAKKCLVVDLDNTLWGGVVGEVGIEGIALGPGYPGLAYQSFQAVLLSYWRRGVVLAIASRNNAEDVDAVFTSHPHMLLRKEHFGSIQVNWRRKSEQLHAIAEEINIGLDSLVFLDDDAANREEVKMALPMVTVPDLAPRPEEYARQVLSFTYFNQISLTDEDRAKGKMYSEERQRKEVIAESGDAYLAKLGIVITLTENKPEDLERLAQLSQKTNQCNLTTRRYSRADLEQMIAGGASVFGASVEDRFGKYGTVVLAVVRFNPEPELDTFLMSCRVMGRSVEYRVLDRIFELLRGRGHARVKAAYVKTAKNEPVRELLPQLGFVDGVLELGAYGRQKPAHVADAIPLVALR